jgi:hypothetical protein
MQGVQQLKENISTQQGKDHCWDESQYPTTHILSLFVWLVIGADLF